MVTSPRLWWEKLAEELRKIEVKVQGEVLRFEHHPLDPCLLLLRGEDGRLHGLLLTHVDDLLLATSPGTMEETQAALSAIFPIADWEMDNFDYTGSNIKQNGSIIEVSQKPYVNTRLETVDIPKNVDPNDLADQVTKQDNMSTIGALSWLSSQTRPDLQAGVSMAQRRQKQPTYGDVKETNRLVRMAQSGKEEPLRFEPLGVDPRQLVLLAYHDAAWANAPLDSKEVLEGQPAKALVVGWKSHACPRICRSTFASEVMAGLEGWEDGLAFRSMLSAALHRGEGAFSETFARSFMPLVSITDCKSVYDNIHRLGSPKTPSEKRLILNVIALRKMVQEEQDFWGPELLLGRALRWVPTDFQMADVLTKTKPNVCSWWSSMRILRLPFAMYSFWTFMLSYRWPYRLMRVFRLRKGRLCFALSRPQQFSLQF